MAGDDFFGSDDIFGSDDLGDFGEPIDDLAETPDFDALTGGIITGLAMMCTAASAILLARIIGTVTSAQQDGRSASRVFA